MKQKRVRLFAGLTGEMSVESIPLAKGVNLEALKAGDDSPLEVVVEVPAGKSKRGWNYTETSLKKIVDAVNTRTLAGYKGHQKPEDVGHQFVPPATHWVGALWQNGRAYFRGVVDKAETDLKRWVKAGRINQVSIFGLPKLARNAAGETEVVDYEPLSIDWTPLDRAGMPTRLVAVSGEMYDALGNVTFAGELDGGEEGEMNWKELMAKLKEAIRSGEATVAQVFGEMGWTPTGIAGEMQTGDWANALKTPEALAKVKAALGVTGEMDPVARATEAKKALDAQATANHDKLVGEVLAEKVKAEKARPIIGEMAKARVKPGMTKEQIAGELDAVLATDSAKLVLDRLHVDVPSSTAKDDNRAGAKAGSATRVKRAAV